jgi:hypothetical protein
MTVPVSSVEYLNVSGGVQDTSQLIVPGAAVGADNVN